MQVQRSGSKHSAWMYWGAVALLGVSNSANASSQAFERDLRERLSRDGGEVTFSRVYEDAEQDAHIAEDIAAQRPDGTSISIGRYTVEGDYDAPAAISLQEVVLNDPAIGEDGVTLEALRIAHPEHAVRFLSVLDEPDFRFDDIEATGFRMSLPDRLFGAERLDVPVRNVVIDALSASGVTQHGVEHLSARGITSDLVLEAQDGGSAHMNIDALNAQGIGWQDDSFVRTESIELDQMRLESELWQVGFDRFWWNGETFNGTSGVEGGFADLGRWLEHLPAQDGEQFRMIYNALVGESDMLHVSGEHNARLSEGDKRVLETDGHLFVPDAGRMEYDLSARLQLPEGIEPNFELDDEQFFEMARLNGGSAALTYDDEGVLPRVLQALAEMRGVSANETLAQLRQELVSTLEGAAPGFEKIPLGLFTIMQGEADHMAAELMFPKGILVSEWLMGPLFWNERYGVSVELE